MLGIFTLYYLNYAYGKPMQVYSVCFCANRDTYKNLCDGVRERTTLIPSSHRTEQKPRSINSPIVCPVFIWWIVHHLWLLYTIKYDFDLTAFRYSALTSNNNNKKSSRWFLNRLHYGTISQKSVKFINPPQQQQQQQHCHRLHFGQRHGKYLFYELYSSLAVKNIYGKGGFCLTDSIWEYACKLNFPACMAL